MLKTSFFGITAQVAFLGRGSCMLLMVLNSLLKLDKLLASFSHRSILFWPEQFSKGQVARRSSDAIKHAMQFTNCDMNAKLSMSIVRRCRSMANVQIVEGGGLMPPVQNAST